VIEGRVLSPSDDDARSDGDGRLVGGRIERRGDAWYLTDAFVERALPETDGLASSALAVLRCSVRAGRITEASLVELHPTPGGPPAATGRDVVRMRDRGVAARLRERARALAVVRNYFEEHGFLEVETPSLVPCPGLDLHLEAFRTLGEPERYLITSPEYQMKRLLVGGIPRIYQLARSFRRGELGVHHTPEFTMLEWYRAFASMDDLVRDTEALVERVFVAMGGGTRRAPRGRELDVATPWPRWTVARAFEELAGVPEATMLDWAHRDEERFFRTLVETIEPTLAALGTPSVLLRYPAPMASLARLCPDDSRYAERFEVYAAGLELCNGFGELTCPVEQRARFEHDRAQRRARGLDVYPLDERFLEALGAGMPPSAGNALGFDRLLALSLGSDDIHELQAFPPGELEP
jgi:lysyl-tRNA synthetase class 2